MVMRKRRSAYTLFELLLVLAILVVLAAIAFPTLNGLSGNKGLTGKRGQTAALDGVRSAVARARARAMADGVPYRLAVVPGKGNYRIAPDTDQYWGGASSGQGAGGKVLVVSDALVEGSCFGTPNSDQGSAPRSGEQTALPPREVASGRYQTLVTFLPDGSARDDGKIAVCTAEANRVIVKVQALTGVVTTQEE
jgi:prepilin-type N-terminal cleavage/methylation domain-containing protein